MGNPQHYSSELPERCLRLIEDLWPHVEAVHVPGQQELGPLTTTFLLAMATPIVSLPIERIERHFSRKHEGYVDDGPLNRMLAEEVGRVFRRSQLAGSPFYEPGRWRFASFPFRGENFSRYVPDHVFEQLAADDALVAADRLPISEWASCLRNALAHGGVLYFGADGRSTEGQRAEALGFVSAKYPDGKPHDPPERLKVLGISEDAFRTFLKRWVEWLSSSGLSQALAA